MTELDANHTPYHHALTTKNHPNTNPVHPLITPPLNAHNNARAPTQLTLMRTINTMDLPLTPSKVFNRSCKKSTPTDQLKLLTSFIKILLPINLVFTHTSRGAF